MTIEEWKDLYEKMQQENHILSIYQIRPSQTKLLTSIGDGVHPLITDKYERKLKTHGTN